MFLRNPSGLAGWQHLPPALSDQRFLQTPAEKDGGQQLVSPEEGLFLSGFSPVQWLGISVDRGGRRDVLHQLFSQQRGKARPYLWDPLQRNVLWRPGNKSDEHLPTRRLPGRMSNPDHRSLPGNSQTGFELHSRDSYFYKEPLDFSVFESKMQWFNFWWNSEFSFYLTLACISWKFFSRALVSFIKSTDLKKWARSLATNKHSTKYLSS